ncbi:hypothetical protein ACSNOK_25360 [Streptomyces sp. URMC 126]|uniref:hypothetical protein n=1 Tax=Streptomyces sp. URMC 126 TaxID=3423401 RepID=UPI003F1C6710
MSPAELPADVAETLGILLDGDDPVRRALRAQVPHVRVTGRCGCGCGTAFFALDADGVTPAPASALAPAPAPATEGTVVAVAAQLFTDDGGCPGEVLVFTQGGYLAWLEVCSWSDGVEVTLDTARSWLRARSRTGA